MLGLTIPPMKQFGPMLIVWGAAMATLLITRELGTSLMFFGAFLALLYVATGRFSFPLIGLVLFALGVWYVTGHVSHVHRTRGSVGTPVQPGRSTTGPWAAATSSRSRCSRRPTAASWAPGFDRSLLQYPVELSNHTVVHRFILPVPESDMIYAVIVNELGLLGGAALLLVFLLLVARGLKIAVMARDSFSKLLATGLSFIIALQVFVIVGGVTRVIPLTGVTLPFVAYGGSSVVMNFVLVALLLVISDRARRPYEELGGSGRRSVPAVLAVTRSAGPVVPCGGEAAGFVSALRRCALSAAGARPGAVEQDRCRWRARTAPVAVPASRCAAAPPRGALSLRAGAADGTSSPAGLHGGPWPARLRRALDHEHFELHYQPIVALRDGRVSHYEALLRLADDPGGGLLAPGAFLPAAERYGLIREIDRMVLARVARMLGRDPAMAGVTIAINVSALSVTDPAHAALHRRHARPPRGRPAAARDRDHRDRRDLRHGEGARVLRRRARPRLRARAR